MTNSERVIIIINLDVGNSKGAKLRTAKILNIFFHICDRK